MNHCRRGSAQSHRPESPHSYLAGRLLVGSKRRHSRSASINLHPLYAKADELLPPGGRFLLRLHVVSGGLKVFEEIPPHPLSCWRRRRRRRQRRGEDVEEGRERVGGAESQTEKSKQVVVEGAEPPRVRERARQHHRTGSSVVSPSSECVGVFPVVWSCDACVGPSAAYYLC